ncbi:hypothetical protein [Vibrio brasiliensis]|uniref:hypothetical protein n=1 Tax=Vibrio brasiliensis TaxID=170652 RepID=UPI001EFDF15B|nr:hypothetical protein [Vibrio brasiliensis]MCG9726703.1 hypothetical protein [Vibrio brasiliensis]
MTLTKNLWLVATVLLFSVAAEAGKPVKSDGTYLGNGFPSGEHFNLILHGKKDTHVCETYVEIVEITDTDLGDVTEPFYAIGDKYLPGECPTQAGFEYRCAYGNVISMPRGSDSSQILMESGSKGPAKKSGSDADLDSTTLQVTDACTGYSGNDPAVVRIPADKDGYAVYARVLGKPTDDGGPDFSVTGREIPIIGDGDNTTDDVWLIGVIDNEGALIPGTCDDGGCTLERWESTEKGKGAKTATNLTGLFSFSGEVCYWEDDESCLDGNTNVCSDKDFCCTVVDEYDGLGDIEYNGTVYDCEVADDTTLDEFGMCLADGDVVDTLHCRTYEEEWIFNIEDFVNVLFDINNDAYNVQIRLYPLPLK